MSVRFGGDARLRLAQCERCSNGKFCSAQCRWERVELGWRRSVPDKASGVHQPRGVLALEKVGERGSGKGAAVG
jgi:hypothetical protein